MTTQRPGYISSNSGKVAVVTGGNSGIGFWTCRGLSSAGATVVLACRSMDRGRAAIAALLEEVPHGKFDLLRLDLSDLAAVRSAVQDFQSRYDRLDILVNNAGVALAPFGRTADGFEAHFGVNFLGHFALTGLLIETVLATPSSRIVHVGSLTQRIGRICFDDPHFEHRRYRSVVAYSQSKLATVMFMLELDRRLRLADSTVISSGGHPGAALTNIANDLRVLALPGVKSFAQWLIDSTLNIPEFGAQPLVYAATEPSVTGGTYYGPGGRLEIKGAPSPARLPSRSKVTEDATRLWRLAESLTGVRYLTAGD